MAVDTLSGLDALELAERQSEPSRLLRIWGTIWPKLAALAIALAFWQLAFVLELRPSYTLPSPAEAFTELAERAQRGELWKGIAITARRAAMGYGFSLILGVGLGLAVARVRVLRVAIGSMITALQTMPSIAWFPLAILLFGLTEQAIFFVVVLGAAPSIANGVIAGIDYVPPLFLRAGRNLGARGLKLYWYIIAPAALPSFVSGLKQGWAFSWRSLMAGELIIVGLGKTSLGGQLTLARELIDPPGVIAMMIVILLFGLVVDYFFSKADRLIRNRWGLIEQ
ncbi:sulfate ABC transporter permease [Rhizocola hellebori]|uniref:Sulfate ABC transporter permease n=1 Tax=Rhizocola hellebori TaxID=1392758 RepID=A0A8J3VMQ1_9ACTN|nr:ABC transporter permease [Rhizocola hellebori]GIH11576.1 sulfate ABC transporter permease [Rhizocola hellebori]